MIISFAGHSSVEDQGLVKELVKEQIRSWIKKDESVICYLGGYGEFDDLCASACRELRQDYAGIKLVYVTPYITLSEQKKIREMRELCLYDDFIYPPIEDVPKRFAISKRNEWMMSNAELVILYVNKTYGGAYKSFLVAKRKKKNMINICDMM